MVSSRIWRLGNAEYAEPSIESIQSSPSEKELDHQTEGVTGAKKVSSTRISEFQVEHCSLVQVLMLWGTVMLVFWCRIDWVLDFVDIQPSHVGRDS
jgi:hypothetical protein